MTARPPEDDLKALGSKIDAARDARKPPPRKPGNKYSAAGFGWRMTLDLVTGVGVGAAMGWGLDSVFGTMPVFLLIMVMFGFAAGVKVMLKSVEDYQKDQAGEPAKEGKENGSRT